LKASNSVCIFRNHKEAFEDKSAFLSRHLRSMSMGDKLAPDPGWLSIIVPQSGMRPFFHALSPTKPVS